MKRLFALVLAAAMCFGLLCACGEPTEKGNEGAPGTDSVKELMSKVEYLYTREKGGKIKEESYVIDIQWTENGATVEGYQQTEEGRYETTMELTLDDQKRPVTMTQTETSPNGEVSQYTVVLSYEKERQIKRTVTDGDGDTRTNTYTFDENGRLIQEENGEGYTEGYEYDAHGNCIRNWWSYADTTETRETRTAYTYDETGKITLAEKSHSYSDTQTQIHYYYYPNGNVMMEMKVSNRGDVNFGFYPNNPKDTVGWSYGASEGASMNCEYTVEKDARGYITKVVRTNTESGVVTTATMEYDQNGNLVKCLDFTGRNKQWEYDSQNRLVKYAMELGESSHSTVYEYDDQGRLISQKKTTATGESEIQTWGYNEAGMTVKRTEKDVYAEVDGTLEQTMEIEYIENSNCPISNEWVDFFLANLFDVT